MVLLVLVISGT